MQCANPVQDQSLAFQMVDGLPEFQRAAIVFDRAPSIAQGHFGARQILQRLRLPGWGLSRVKKVRSQLEQASGIIIAFQNKVNATQIIDRHPLAKSVAQRAVVAQSHSKIFQRFLVLTGIMIRPAKVVQHRRLSLHILQNSKEFQRLEKVFDCLLCVSPLFVMTAEIVQGNALPGGITHALCGKELLLKLF